MTSSILNAMIVNPSWNFWKQAIYYTTIRSGVYSDALNAV
jgi:hypothetical protein